VTKYKHSEHVHNLESPQEIVPIIVKLLQPQSVVDIGCGIGTFLHLFKKEGVPKVLGVDGPWVNKELLHKYIDPEEFLEQNLEEAINLKQQFDLAISLEVAEHLSEKAARQFVKSLVNAGKRVLFSAAIPLQGGQNHINEQWLSYWEKLFQQEGYELYDVIRPLFWENDKVFSWYKQNMVLFAPKGEEWTEKMASFHGKNIVHPDLFTLKAELAEQISRPSFFNSLKLLVKSILR
jgi:SAM-dependent methyltransferase